MRVRFIFLGFVICLLLVGTAQAATSSFSGTRDGTSRYVNYQQPDFRSYYSGQQLTDYWPILGEDQKSTCEHRQDLLINVAPLGCQPAVVRSDLLAEQNVPVFCQLNAFRVNPLIDITQIRNLRFSGKYPADIVGVGFHPAQAALQSRSELVGSPFLNNIGYAVVVLRRQENESRQPDFVNVTLQASVDYRAGNALGVGSSSFYLRPVSESSWKSERLRQSFFKGRYFIRLDSVDEERARISFYKGDSKVGSVTVAKGSSSNNLIYLPGTYCQAGLRVFYDSYDSARTLAQLEVGDDVIEVPEGSRFANDKCTITSVSTTGTSGRVSLSCGSEKVTLSLTEHVFNEGDSVVITGRESEGVFKVITHDLLIGNYTLKDSKGASFSVDSSLVYLKDVGLLTNADLTNDIKLYFNTTLDTYRALVRDYPSETKSDSDQTTGADSFGSQGLERAIDLAQKLGQQRTAVELITLYLTLYPDNDGRFSNLLTQSYRYDSGSSSTLLDINGELTDVRLIGVRSLGAVSSAKFTWGATSFTLPLESNTTLGTSSSLALTSIDKESARVTARCALPTGVLSSPESFTLSLRSGQTQERTREVCGGVLRLDSISLENYARVRVVPETQGTTVQTNFTVGVGIEKRALALAPEKAQERIDTLNETIHKWESISTGLGNVVKTMKGACFATAGVLTVKNFVTGLDGTALARQKVMRGSDGWTEWCRNHVNVQSEPSYSSLEACYDDNNANIDRDVDTMASLISADNQRIEALEKNYKKDSGVFGSYVEGDKAKEKFISQELASYGDQEIVLADGPVQVRDLTREVNGESALTYQEAKDLKLYLDLRARSDSPVAQGLADETLRRIATSTTARLAEDERRVGLSNSLGSIAQTVPQYADKDALKGEYTGSVADDALLGEIEGLSADDRGKPAQLFTYNNQLYLAILEPTTGDSYRTLRVYKLEGQVGSYNALPDADVGSKFSDFKRSTRASCSNAFASDEAKVQFYETEPYKGMPAIVPFDLQQGWYVGTRQTVAALGGIKAFQSSGRPASFWVCNVGADGRPDFFVSGFDDDVCQQFNLETGVALNKFSCLSESETREVVTRAVRALEDAATQRSRGATSSVQVEGKSMKVGAPAVNIPGTQCQDFMSPDDCRLLYNVCDPVICPTSRCDFGGAYPVTDVIQSGVIGSTLLCLPNFPQVAIPVCLSGIKAGIDGYLSVLKSYQSCLQENVNTGTYIGICDQISAVYMCEFFWRQAAPLANIALPKLIENVYGNTAARGGGEYATVQTSWDNAQASVDYFTQQYAVNSLTAFNARSVEEAGGEFCKAFISAKAPAQFKSLIEPDSPSQFHAWFSQIPYSDTTVPATAQYKVFYHIFAGNDQGVSYQIYLKDPPQTSYYQSTSTLQVQGGYVPRGQYATETRDFTAPAGYQQLCVRINDKEECGFKQVTTSFALNEIRDSFVQDELERDDITTEDACISGRLNPTALLNPNLQEAAQETIDPAVYNRGVSRICATDNPGRTTDPARFVKVGVCDDARVGCWLDTQSVDRALTVNNVGARNETLSEITTSAKEQLQDDDEFLFGEGEDKSIRTLSTKALASSILSVNEGKNLITEASTLYGKVILSSQKAELLYLQGVVYEAITRGLWVNVEQPTTTPTSTPTTSEDSTPESIRTPWTTETALEELDNLNLGDSYSDHIQLILEFYGDGLLTTEQFREVNGQGAFNLQEKLSVVREYLLARPDASSTSEPGSRPASLNTTVPVYSLDRVYDPVSTTPTYILWNNKRTIPPLYVLGTRIMCEGCGARSETIQVGTLRQADEGRYSFSFISQIPNPDYQLQMNAYREIFSTRFVSGSSIAN